MDEERSRFSGERRDAAAQEAARWFARWQAGTVDEAAFERWRGLDPANALAFARVTNAWEAAVETPEPIAVTPIWTRRRMMRGGVAGAAVAASATGLFASRAYAWESASTAVGETRKLRLSDGSMVALNTDTVLSWRFSASARELWLERGEVALDLQPGADARLLAEDVDAVLTSGRFNARMVREQLDLTVFRGRAVAAAVTVQPFQRARLGKAAPAISPLSSDAAEAALAWQSGDVVFHDTPLSEAVAEYNRYLLRKIVINDAHVGAVRVGGRFISSDPSDFLGALSTGFGVRVKTTPTGHHLGR